MIESDRYLPLKEYQTMKPIFFTQESEQRDATKKKVDKKMETRALKKEMKKDLGVDKCKQQ